MDQEEANGDSHWLRNLAVLLSSQLVAMVALSSVMPFVPLYVQRLGVLTTDEAVIWAGVLASGGAIAMAVTAPIWGSLADRRGRKLMVERSMFAGALFVGAMGLVQNVHQLLALRIAQGAFTGTITASRTLVASIAPRRHLGTSMGLMQTAVFVGSSAGPLVGGVIADNFGYRAAFAVTAVLLVASGTSVVFLVQEKFESPATNGHGSPGMLDNVRLLFRSPQLAAMIAALFSVQLGGMVVSPVLPLFVQSLTGDGEQVASMAGLVLGVAAAASAVSAVVIGRLSDRIGYRRVLTVCAIGVGLLNVPQAFVTDPYQLLAVRAMMGVFSGGVLPSAMAIIGLAGTPESRGWLFGLTASASAVGNAIGPLMGAGVAATFGLRHVFLVTAIFMTLAGVWVASVVREPSRAMPGGTPLPAADGAPG